MSNRNSDLVSLDTLELERLRSMLKDTPESTYLKDLGYSDVTAKYASDNRNTYIQIQGYLMTSVALADLMDAGIDIHKFFKDLDTSEFDKAIHGVIVTCIDDEASRIFTDLIDQSQRINA